MEKVTVAVVGPVATLGSAQPIMRRKSRNDSESWCGYVY